MARKTTSKLGLKVKDQHNWDYFGEGGSIAGGVVRCRGQDESR